MRVRDRLPEKRSIKNVSRSYNLFVILLLPFAIPLLAICHWFVTSLLFNLLQVCHLSIVIRFVVNLWTMNNYICGPDLDTRSTNLVSGLSSLTRLGN